MYIFHFVFAIFLLEILAGYVFFSLRRGDSYYKTRFSHYIFRFDRRIGYRLRPNLNYSNPTTPPPTAPRRVMFVDTRTESHGFLGTEEVLAIQGPIIACIGGSTTAGIEVLADQTYPARLDTLMKPMGVRAVNAGVGGYRSIHELLNFRQHVCPLKPKAVIIFSGYNDWEDYAHNLWKPYDPFTNCLSSSMPSNTVEDVLLWSALYYVGKRLYYRALRSVRTETPDRKRIDDLDQSLLNPVWLPEWETNIGAIMEECASAGINCYLLGHASPVYDNAPEEAKVLADRELNMAGRWDIYARYLSMIYDAGQDLCEKYGAHFIDAGMKMDLNTKNDDGSIDFRKRFLYFVDRCHFSESGNQVLAEWIFSEIRNLEK